MEFVKELDVVPCGFSELELESETDAVKDDFLARDGGGEFYKVGVSPRVARIEHVDYVYQFEIEIQRGWGVDSVHFEIQIGGERNFLNRGTPEGLKKGDSAQGLEVVEFASK